MDFSSFFGTIITFVLQSFQRQRAVFKTKGRLFYNTNIRKMARPLALERLYARKIAFLDFFLEKIK